MALNVVIEETQNHYTVVTAPLGIEPSIGKTSTTTVMGEFSMT